MPWPHTTTYSASYDAAGNMLCRAPTNGDCTNSGPTAQQMSYDNEGRLISWQNAPSSPTSTASFFYDGEGNRVLQQSTVNGTTTTATYIGSLEEVSTTGSNTTTTTYYYLNGHRIALSVNGTISYLAGDLLGSAEVALNSSGTATASVLYGPYGTVRYANGAMPTDYDFTGQRGDTTTGLDYYGSRYYDPIAGQFTSADSDSAGGLNRYAYVHDDPETFTDPTGHVICDPGTNNCTWRTGPHVIREWDQWSHRWSRDDRFNLVESFYETIYDQWSNGRVTEDTYFKYANSWCDATCHQDRQAAARAQATRDKASVAGIHIPHIPWQDLLSHARDWGNFLLLLAGGIAGLVAAFTADAATSGAAFLQSVTWFVNGIDGLVHAAAIFVGIVWGKATGAYLTLQSVGLALDLFASVLDFASLTDIFLEGGRVVSKVAGVLYAVFSIDLYAFWNDLFDTSDASAAYCPQPGHSC